MAKGVDFTLTGQVTWLKDFPPAKYGGAIGCMVKMPAQQFGQSMVPEHTVFVNVGYSQQDGDARRPNPGLVAFKQRLQKGCYILARGSVKPKQSTKRPNEHYSLDTNWRSVIVLPGPGVVINRVVAEVEVVTVAPHSVTVKYSYANPQEKDPKLKWKERQYAFATLIPAPKSPKETMYGEGSFFGVHPATKEQVTWIGLHFLV